ncbi:MAG: ribosome recycling factor [Bacteroidales bacterium]|nr:ribosome recycling factor [Bacteroidales bacterium]MBP5644476.1 ribosome recycling factor [Bacteroidales bacterium]
MSDKDIQEFAETLQYGLSIAERRMLEEKALRGQDIVVCRNDGTIQRIPAKEAIKAL